MTLAELRRAIELLPERAAVTLPREALLDALTKNGSESEPNGRAPENPPAPDSDRLLTVKEAACSNPSEPVPGCDCEHCTGVPADAPLRARTQEQRKGQWHRPLPVENARAVPILQVVRRLGLGDPVRRGKEYAVRCPLHDDHRPSLMLDLGAGLWYCFVCGVGGDGIELWRRVRHVSFAEAVKDLAR